MTERDLRALALMELPRNPSLPSAPPVTAPSPLLEPPASEPVLVLERLRRAYDMSDSSAIESSLRSLTDVFDMPDTNDA